MDTLSRMTTVGVIGLGVMGLAMAQNLSRSGFTVYGYDIDAKRKNYSSRPTDPFVVLFKSWQDTLMC